MRNENEIGKNFSSGAEKVERIEKTTTESVNSYTGTPFEKTTLETEREIKEPVANAESKKEKKLREMRLQKERRAEKERLAAERRTQAALKKQERKEIPARHRARLCPVGQP